MTRWAAPFNLLELYFVSIEWMRSTGTIVHARRDVAAMIQSQLYFLKLFNNKYGVTTNTTVAQVRADGVLMACWRRADSARTVC